MSTEQEKREDLEEIAEIMQILPEDDKQKLYGVAIGLKLAGQTKAVS
ncbi:hypothetical protein RWV98_05535 [Agathobaculum sp. NTUH-O15-33]|nr:hypothetical protein [Agathobaculum sp. NTUH-O15-33]WNX85729.1 hypothetical protein RWV98_05535 [Agathobaculum sp. NTUH-O15-33]